jgi:O-methyltransferase
MFELAKRAHWLQTLLVRLLAAVPPAIEHNVQKTLAIKKALYFAFLEQIEGDYLEFGTFEGTSLIAAFEHDRRFRTASTPRRAFWGFDSFEGFKYFDERDHHPFFKEGEFASSYEQTQRRLEKRIKGRAEWTLVKGYFEDSIQAKTALDLGIERISVALIDCDLGTPALIALNFMAPALQNGTVLILDDYFAYGGSLTDGVAGAFKTFKDRHSGLIFRRLFDYGHGGQAVVLVEGAQER